MKEKFFFASILLLAISIRFFLIFRDSVPFPYDMGRDLLWAKDISFYHMPTLIGPAASIWGIYFGPLWFYYLSIPLFIFGGSPLSSVYATLTAVILTGVLSYFLFRNYFKKSFALLLMIIMFFGFIFINISTYAFHANVLPLLTLFTIFFLFLAIVKRSIFIAFSFFTISLMFHADPAGAIVFVPLPIIVFFLFKIYKLPRPERPRYSSSSLHERAKNSQVLGSMYSLARIHPSAKTAGFSASEYKKCNFKKLFLTSFSLFTIPFVPQIIFELRNDFIETKSLLMFYKGENPSLSGSLPFLERVVNRFEILFDFFKSALSPQNNFVAVIFLTIIFIGIIRTFSKEISKNLQILLKLNLITLATIFSIFTFLINVEVKVWYLYPLSIIFAFIFAISLYTIKNRSIIAIFLTLFLLVNLYPPLSKEQLSRKDPSKLQTQLQAIDLIYTNPHDTFSVYVFTPVIYDLGYQYLFWWYGIVKKMGLPNEFAYLPKKPAYVKNKEFYQPIETPTKTIYLIVELSAQNPHYSRDNWLKNFRDYKTEWTTNINDAILLEKRNK